ncbi:hypothetical protein IAR50_000232 [Cryptococcus sp. DSM 104548]
MSNIFNKFRKSSQSDARSRRSASTNSTSGPLSDDDGPRTSTVPSPSPSRRAGASGSLFIEDFSPPTDSSSNDNTVTSSGTSEARTPNKPGALSVPSSAQQQQPLGTPKFTLTQDGSDSPRSFDGSPVQGRSTNMNHDNGSDEPVGLGLGKTSSGVLDEDDLETPTLDSGFANASPARVPTVSSATDLSSRDRASSLTFADGNTRSRSGSMVSRITNRHGPASPNSLMPVDQKGSVSSKKSRKRDRRRSVNSNASGQSSSLAALARGGLQMAGPASVGDELHIRQHKGRRVASPLKRSPYLTRGEEGEGDELDDEYGEGFDDDEDDDSDLEDALSVLGYAVASNRRNADFHQVFPSVDEGDYLIDDYGCAYAKDILVQGRAYISENYICFHANIFGWTTDLVIPFTEIKSIEKKMTALVIPNAIGVNTATARYTFASFISRDTVYDVMMNIWRLCNPNAVMSSLSLPGTNTSRPASISGEPAEGDDAPSGPSPGHQIIGASVKGAGSETHKPTQCACGKDGKHYPEIALEATFPSTPEKVYNLMFNSGWLKTFLSDSQQLRDIEYSDWRTGEGSSQLTRSLSYIKPLNGSIGPKQTTCHITDSRDHFEPEEYIAMVTTTRTPDVPSGGVFSVKTRTCFMWAGGNSTKVVVTTGVEWTGKSWIKGIIEKSAIDGQKTYHDDLKLSMLSYIQSHISEFLPPGAQASVDTPAPGTPAAEVATTGEKQTDAQEYAKKARKDRQEQGWGMMQAGIDSFVAGGKGVVSGVKFCVDGLGDLAFPSGLSKQSLTTLIIIVLVISNVWTYIAFSGGQQRSFLERRSAKRGNDEVAEAVKMVLGQRRDPVQEAQELVRVLDFVEGRLGKLREEAKTLGNSAVGGGGNNGEDLD